LRKAISTATAAQTATAAAADTDSQVPGKVLVAESDLKSDRCHYLRRFCIARNCAMRFLAAGLPFFRRPLTRTARRFFAAGFVLARRRGAFFGARRVTVFFLRRVGAFFIAPAF